VALAYLATVGACSDNRPLPSARQLELTTKFAFQESNNRDLDILFEIQNSVDGAPPVADLINVLKNLPGGLPNVHIGIVTSDMGAGAFTGSVDGCGNPDLGALVDKSRAATDPVCATAQLNPGQHFISSVERGAQNNFAGDISDVFNCIAQVGTTGCGFEQPLEAVRAALGDPTGDPAHDIPIRPVPPNNVGFLRPNASLLVIFVSSSQECSSPPDSLLFDPGPGTDANLGPLEARCFAHTDVCDGQPVINYIRAGTPAGPFQNCVPDELTFSTDPKHAAIPVQFYIDYFKRLKPDPSLVFVAGIIAPPSPYTLVSVPDGLGGTVIAQGDSCTGAAGVFGRPAPRWTKFFGGFDTGHSTTTSICGSSFVTALENVAVTLRRSPGQPCAPGPFLDVMGPNGPRPDCTVVQHAIDDSGNPVESALPSCLDDENQAPCWSMAPGTASLCPGQEIVSFMWPASSTTLTDIETMFECAQCPRTHTRRVAREEQRP
jgi:hypothetical protein